MLDVPAGAEVEGMGRQGLDHVTRRDRAGQGGRAVEGHVADVAWRRRPRLGDELSGKRATSVADEGSAGRPTGPLIRDIDIPLGSSPGRHSAAP